MRKRRNPCARNCPPCSAIGGRCNRTTHPVVGNCSALALPGSGSSTKASPSRPEPCCAIASSVACQLSGLKETGCTCPGKNGRPGSGNSTSVSGRTSSASAGAAWSCCCSGGKTSGSRSSCWFTLSSPLWQGIKPFPECRNGGATAAFQASAFRKPIVGARGSLEVTETEDEPQLASWGRSRRPGQQRLVVN